MKIIAKLWKFLQLKFIIKKEKVEDETGRGKTRQPEL